MGRDCSKHRRKTLNPSLTTTCTSCCISRRSFSPKSVRTKSQPLLYTPVLWLTSSRKTVYFRRNLCSWKTTHKQYVRTLRPSTAAIRVSIAMTDRVEPVTKLHPNVSQSVLLSRYQTTPFSTCAQQHVVLKTEATWSTSIWGWTTFCHTYWFRLRPQTRRQKSCSWPGSCWFQLQSLLVFCSIRSVCLLRDIVTRCTRMVKWSRSIWRDQTQEKWWWSNTTAVETCLGATAVANRTQLRFKLFAMATRSLLITSAPTAPSLLCFFCAVGLSAWFEGWLDGAVENFLNKS